MAKPKKGLKKWFEKENWVDISAPKKSGGFEKCGRKSANDSKRGYPKCVPAAKAAQMSEKQVASAVRRKRSKKQGVGGKPTNVATFAKEGGEIMKMKAKGMKRGGATKAKGMKKGGAMKAKGMNKGGKIKAKGMAKGGKMATKGYAKGGAMRTKGAAKGGMRKPSSKNSGLYGR